MHHIYIETTANPRIIKFVSDYSLISGSLELDRSSDITEIPLAQQLFQYPFVEKIYITANFIAVSKMDDVDWELISEILREVIEAELKVNPKIYKKKKVENFPIFTEMTPNPNVMKFISQKELLNGFIEVNSNEDSIDIPLAHALFKKFNIVRKVFISDHFVAVTKDESVEWHEVMIAIKDYIEDFILTGKKLCNINPQQHEKPVEEIIQRDYTEDEQKIADILAEYVAPAIDRDGGKISLMEYVPETKTAKMLLQGSCSGCPSSIITLKNGIENILKQFVPELVENVEAINA